MKKILLFILITFVNGCSTDEHSNYKAIQNNLQPDGPTINYDPNSSLTNISEIQEYLNEKDSETFTESLSWYGTESNYGLNKIHNKNAKELVDIVNCLKISIISEQDNCFNK